MDTLNEIWTIIQENLARAWPLLAASVPFAVILRASGLSERLKNAFGRRPVIGILIATAAGAFGPFCSCTVIPVIASMLIGGIPLPSVMAFWIASPTMDPEIFFMSAAFLGWDLAVARLAATLTLSLAGGFATLWLVRRGWIEADFLRAGAASSTGSVRTWARLRALVGRLRSGPEPRVGFAADAEAACGCSAEPAESEPTEAPGLGTRLAALLRESIRVTLWIGQFLVLAFVLEALILVFVPQETIVGWIGTANPIAPLLAALIGIPLYTGNMTAVPLIGGLLQQGMAPGAALAFLIAGPITTIPAMAAVWGVVKRRVFLVYLGIGLVGALVLGYAYGLIRLALSGRG